MKSYSWRRGRSLSKHILEISLMSFSSIWISSSIHSILLPYSSSSTSIISNNSSYASHWKSFFSSSQSLNEDASAISTSLVLEFGTYVEACSFSSWFFLCALRFEFQISSILINSSYTSLSDVIMKYFSFKTSFTLP